MSYSVRGGGYSCTVSQGNILCARHRNQRTFFLNPVLLSEKRITREENCHSLSIKLPLSLWLLVLFFLPPPNMPPLLLLLDLSAAPPAQNKTVAKNRQTTAAHMKPKL